ncbi:MAG: CstA-like transporter-associated (seleno)protein [Aromatoleum sp.]|jgi:uncharacterized short protein YbdD (DUF466 family)|uniref:CstA-like transporter-associated (seleno)protein n=1 Tax=Aromatoleum sp. TaxID=2307007 RepID=UPI0028951123|nr:CstA-like transporter-associated (seleno)protein [Aromatoleum sp.]MDT3670234.1 CstA-like transporter-associated (seleno)protein [Aromatoleum sp.]
MSGIRLQDAFVSAFACGSRCETCVEPMQQKHSDRAVMTYEEFFSEPQDVHYHDDAGRCC